MYLEIKLSDFDSILLKILYSLYSVDIINYQDSLLQINNCPKGRVPRDFERSLEPPKGKPVW